MNTKMMNTKKWKPKKSRTQEDRLLYRYCRSVGGVTFTGVPLGDKREPRRARIIDAVRLVGPRGERRIVQYRLRRNAADLSCRLSDARRKGQKVEVIEVKRELNRGVIGQVLVAGYLFQRKNKLTPEMVVVCGRKKLLASLKGFCRHSNILVKAL